VKGLGVGKDSLKLIKKLLIKYGLAIMVFLKPFYQTLSQSDTTPYLPTLRKLAVIAKEMVED